MKKRILSCLMALALCMTLLPTAALAEGEPAEVSAADALIAALADSTKNHIKLMADIEISAMLTVSRAVTLDLNGNVLKRTDTGRVIEVQNNGNLTLTDSTPSATHSFKVDESTKLWILDKTNGTNTVNGGVITGGNANANNNDGGGVIIVSGGTFTMTGGNIVGCTAGSGGGVDVSGTFTMTGGSIAGCVAAHASGGGVYVETGGAFEMSGGSIAGCVAANGSGGGICNDGTTKLSGSAKIQDCRAHTVVMAVAFLTLPRKI